MVMPMSTYRARWIMELSTFRPLLSPPEVFGGACVLFAAALACAAVSLVADVRTSSTARTENQQSRSRSRTNTRVEAIPTARQTGHEPTLPLLIKKVNMDARLTYQRRPMSEEEGRGLLRDAMRHVIKK